MTTIRNLLLVLQVFMCQDSVSAYDPVALGLNMSQGMATFQDLTPVNGGTYLTLPSLSLSFSRSLSTGFAVFTHHHHHHHQNLHFQQQLRHHGRTVEMFSMIIRYFTEKTRKSPWWMLWSASWRTRRSYLRRRAPLELETSTP